jgi:hypothetical protein
MSKIKLTSKMRSVLYQMSEKGKFASITNSTMSALEKRGLVEYHTHPTISLSGIWKLTDAGRKFKEESGHGART